ncbi:hypothetical protein JCM8097_003648 [Rhodosporidiobolus ruineniae]
MPRGYSPLAQDPAEQDCDPVLPFAAPSSSPPLGTSSAGLPLSATASSSSASRPVNPFSYPPAPRRSTLGAARKGKGRAVDEDKAEGDNAAPTGPTGLSFCVRFTDGQTDDVLDLWVGEKESVRELKRRIRLIRPRTLYTSDEEGSKPRRLRLIQLGRLLPDGVFLVPYTLQLNSRRAALVSSTEEQPAATAVKEGLEAVGRGIGKVVREVRKVGQGEKDELDDLERGEGSIGKGKEKEAAEEEEDNRIWLHCSVGDAEEEEGEAPGEKKDEEASTEQITPLQGFDRLREAGFSEEDIENLRSEFRERRGIDENEEDGTSQAICTFCFFKADSTSAGDAEHQRALEEQWMSGMTGQEEAAGDASSNGHYISLLKGVCVGFFVPFLPLFFFRSQIFTKRMQIAIVLGICINAVFGVLRLLG